MPKLSKVMATALNQQMTKEFTASHLYRSMASFCYAADFIGAGDFFYTHAAEEQQHAQLLFRYMIDRGIQPLMEAIPAAESEFTDLLDVFNKALDHEVMITESISEILGLAHELRDFQSVAHLNTLMEEQTEEEALFNGIVSQIRRVGVDNGHGLFIMDQELKAMSKAPAAAPITI